MHHPPDAAAIRAAIVPREIDDAALVILTKRIHDAAGHYEAAAALRDSMKGVPTKRHRTNLARFPLHVLIRDCMIAWAAVTGEPIPKYPAGNRTRGTPDHPCIALARLAYFAATGRRLLSDLRRQAAAARAIG